MSSEIEIVNGALVKLGSPTALSINDSVKSVQVLKVRLPVISRAVFRIHPWNKLTHRATLVPTAATPAFGYTYQFELPGACLRVLMVDPDYDGLVDYRLENRYLLSNEQTHELLYIMDDQVFSSIDDLCADAISCRLAWDACFAITQSNELKEQLWKDYRLTLAEARRVDSQEEVHHRLINDDVFVQARRQPAQY